MARPIRKIHNNRNQLGCHTFNIQHRLTLHEFESFIEKRKYQERIGKVKYREFGKSTLETSFVGEGGLRYVTYKAPEYTGWDAYYVDVIINPRRIFEPDNFIDLMPNNLELLKKIWETVSSRFINLGLPGEWQSWKMKRLDLSFNFYEPAYKLLFGILRFCKPPNSYSLRKNTYLHNRKYSLCYESKSNAILIYQKEKTMQKFNKDRKNTNNADYYSTESLAQAKDLIRFEYQMNRRSVRDLEEKWGLSKKSFSLYFNEVNKHIKEYLSEIAIRFFGEEPYYGLEKVREVIQQKIEEDNISKKEFKNISQYISLIECFSKNRNQLIETTSKNKLKCTKTLSTLHINNVIIPTCKVAKRDRNKLPLPSIAHRIAETQPINECKF